MTYWKLERPSKRSGKKWKVRVPTSSGRGKTVAFGDATMSDYTIHKDKARRERYRTRHQHDRIDDPYAPGFWSWWSLWGESSDLAKAHADAVKRAKKILGVKKDTEGNEMATKEPRRNPNPPGTPTPTMAEVAEVITVLDVPKHLRAEFLKGFATEWEHAHTVGYDHVMVGSIVLDHLAEDAHYYRKLRRARLNPAASDTAPSNRVQACFDALLSNVQEQYPSLSCTIEVDETAGERDGKACSRAFAFCEDHGEGGAFRIAIAGKLNDPDIADDSRVDGILRHELAHAVLLHGGDIEHTERDADEVAEALFGSPIFYDEDDVQTTDPSAPGARRPRPEYLDDENGRTLDTPKANPYPTGTMHQLHTVEDVASCLDDCAAQGDAKTPRMLASQLSQQAKQVAGAQSRMLLTLAKAARHCAGAIEARLAGEVDRAMVGERMCERALADAQSPSRTNPEWAKKLGSGLYKGTRYAGETARDLYQGAREAHATHGAEAPAERKNPRRPRFEQYDFRVSKSFLPALFNGDTSGLSSEDEAALDRFLARVMKLGRGHWAEIEEDAGFGKDEITGLGSDRALVAWMTERKNPRRRASESRKAWEARGAAIPASDLVAADVFRTHEQRALARATHTHRLPDIGRLTITPDPKGVRDHASVEVTKAFADQWDHGDGRSYLAQDVMDAAEKHRGDSNFYAVALKYRGREFSKLYPRGAGV